MPDFRISVKVPDLRMFTAENYVGAIAKAQRDLTAPDLKELFNRTTDGWEHNVTFSQRQTITNTSISMRVYTRDKQYALVVKGSPPHIITGDRLGFLLFRPGYRASTSPRIIGSGRHESFGNYIFPRSVNHPGFEPREFDEAIGTQYMPQFQEDMRAAVRSVMTGGLF